MVDQTAIQQNEKLLGSLLDRGDKKFVTQVGIMALTLLTEQLPPDQYKQFLSECANNAVEMHRFKSLGGNVGQEGEQA
jgi:hypothetical protein